MPTAAPIPELESVGSAIDQARTGQLDGWGQLDQLEQWTVYTDGSAPIKNPGGAIGFSAVFLINDSQAWEICGGVEGRTQEPATSNNRAEIAGVLSILETLYQRSQENLPLPSDVEVVCDSQYVVNCAQGKWKKHKNKDLWRRFDQLVSACRRHGIKVHYRWTRAHVGTKWNERADVLAKEGAMRVIGKGSAPKAQENSAPDYHYSLKLFSQMVTRTEAQAVYELATPSRSRRRPIEMEDVITADEAEYHSLILGLSDLLETLTEAGKDPSNYRVRVVTSRDLMQKQLDGIYGVKAERLKPLHHRCRGLMGMLEEVRIDRASKKVLQNLLVPRQS